MNAAHTGTVEREALERSGGALIAAAGVGALSAIFPPTALLALAVLGANAALRSAGERRFDPWTLAGPALAALTVGVFVGLAGAIGVLFVWRLFADARSSAREAERLALAASKPATRALMRVHVWLSPLFGLTLVAYTAPHMVVGLPLDLPHVPLIVPVIAGITLAAALFDWALRCAVDWRLGELAAAPATHLLTHHLLFIAAFGLGLDVSAGIVAMMAWRLAYAAPIRIQPSLTAVP